jgi:ubiquinone/menaquinone biosynthesis C-methylase UbiE
MTPGGTSRSHPRLRAMQTPNAAPSCDERAEQIRAEAQAQWSHDPAGSNAAEADELGTPESFAKVEAYRYAEQPWMHETFRFGRFAGQRVLEIGVGLGTDHLQFARAGARMTGIDLTPRCIDLTRRRFEHEGLESDLRIMDAERLEFDDDSFDAVYSFGVLHHIPSTERAFAEVRRVLRPGGVFLGGLYSRQSWYYARLRLKRLLNHEWREESLDDTLARIEYSTSGAKPFVRLFGRCELLGLLNDAGFSEAAIVRRHVGFGRVTAYVPASVERAFGRVGGWYLVHAAR